MRAWSLRWIDKFFIRRCFSYCFLCNLVNLKKHRLRLWILELKFFEFPALRQYFFVVCNCLKKFRLKFWILILQKSEENSHLNLTKFNRKKIFVKTKLKKINAWKICSWKSSNWKNLLFNNEKTKNYLKSYRKYFFENENGEFLTF